jgi:hypothetical protein
MSGMTLLLLICELFDLQLSVLGNGLRLKTDASIDFWCVIVIEMGKKRRFINGTGLK